MRSEEGLEVELWNAAFGEGEVQNAKVIKVAQMPTQEEVEQHMVTHLPFRSWCVHCVKGKAKAQGHNRQGGIDHDGDVPVVSIDYMFMHGKQKEGEEKGMPIVVWVVRKSKVIRSRVVPQKGRDSYAIRNLTHDVSQLGYKKVVLKSDGEPALIELKRRVKNESGVDIVLEESAAYESEANGEVEVVIQRCRVRFVR